MNRSPRRTPPVAALRRALATWLAAFALVAGAGAVRAQDTPSEIRIGATVSLSGPYQGIVGPFGKLASAWAERVNAKGGIFLKQYNKTLPVKLVMYDDKSEPTTALSFYERLATVDKVDLFIGPFSSGMNNAAMQAALTHQIPYFIPEGNDAVLFDTPNPWRATATAQADAEYQRLSELYARLKGVKTFAILARDNLHEIAAAQGFANRLKQSGYQIVYQDVAPKETKDFASIILKIKQANPDVVSVEGLAPPWTIQFLKQARELGLAPKDVVVSHMPVPVIRALGDASENVIAMLWSYEGDTPDHRELDELCKAAGIERWQYSEAGVRFVTYRWIEEALKRAGTLEHEAVRKAMFEADFTLYGGDRVRINEKGYGSLMTYPMQVRQGRLVSLWPLEHGLAAHAFKDGRW